METVVLVIELLLDHRATLDLPVKALRAVGYVVDLTGLPLKPCASLDVRLPEHHDLPTACTHDGVELLDRFSGFVWAITTHLRDTPFQETGGRYDEHLIVRDIFSAETAQSLFH